MRNVDVRERTGETGVCPYPFDRPSAMEIAREYGDIRNGSAVERVRMPSGDEAYLVTRYEDVRTVLADPRFSRAATLEEGAPRLGPAPQNFPTLLNMDPPDHGRVRKMISRAFTARRVAVLEPHVKRLVGEYLDEMVDRGPTADLIADFALRLPVQVICELLGVPIGDRPKFGAWSRAFLATTSEEYTAEQVTEAQVALFTYLSELIAAKRAEPADDIISDLVRKNDETQEISELELTFLGVTLLVAGHETTVNMIGNGVYALLLNLAEMRRLIEQPELVDTAVEELLRLYGPGTEGLIRITLEDVELSGVVIPAGAAVLPSLVSANRDERTFTDSERCDIARDAAPHLSFSHGPHFCIGAALARVELRESYREILRRLPGLALAVAPEDVPRPTGLLVNGVSELVVTWDDDEARALARDRRTVGADDAPHDR